MVIFMRNKQEDFEDVEPKEFYDFACELNKIKDDLNSTESAVNRNIYMRIYYSVFLFLREWLKRYTHYNSHRKGEHRRLANYIRFKGPFDKGKNELIYRKLTRLKKLRHQADYDLKVPKKSSQDYEAWDFTTIPKAFETAKSIIKDFNEF